MELLFPRIITRILGEPSIENNCYKNNDRYFKIIPRIRTNSDLW